MQVSMDEQQLDPHFFSPALQQIPSPKSAQKSAGVSPPPALQQTGPQTRSFLQHVDNVGWHSQSFSQH
jgi:hypothetical protein